MHWRPIVDSEQLLKLMIHQGYIKEGKLSTGVSAITLTHHGYEAMQMMMLNLKASELTELYVTMLPCVMELDDNREDNK